MSNMLIYMGLIALSAASFMAALILIVRTATRLPSSKSAILPKDKLKKMEDEIERLKAENEKLRAEAVGSRLKAASRDESGGPKISAKIEFNDGKEA